LTKKGEKQPNRHPFPFALKPPKLALAALPMAEDEASRSEPTLQLPVAVYKPGLGTAVGSNLLSLVLLSRQHAAARPILPVAADLLGAAFGEPNRELAVAAVHLAARLQVETPTYPQAFATATEVALFFRSWSLLEPLDMLGVGDQLVAAYARAAQSSTTELGVPGGLMGVLGELARQTSAQTCLTDLLLAAWLRAAATDQAAI